MHTLPLPTPQRTRPPGPQILSTADYLRLPRAPERWVVEGLLPAGGWMLVHGAPKSGKSFAVLDLAATVASGASNAWLSFPVRTTGNVVYLQLDTPRGEWAGRQETLLRQGVDFSNFYTVDRETVPGFNILDPGTHAWLTEWLLYLSPTLLVVDTYRKAFKGKENESDVVEEFLTALETTAITTARVIIHHSRKATQNPRASKEEKEDPLENVRGSSALTGAMDTIAYLKGEKLIYTGRSIDDNFVKLKRLPNYHWAVGNDVEALCREVVGTLPGLSTRQQAQVIADRIEGLGVETARTKLRRWKEEKGLALED